jgi:hypothetical protein
MGRTGLSHSRRAIRIDRGDIATRRGLIDGRDVVERELHSIVDGRDNISVIPAVHKHVIVGCH